jgi:hypothetical protein
LYHTFATGINIASASSSINVNTVSEVNKLSENENNDLFDTTETDMGFLDFSESNPFGDPQ